SAGASVRLRQSFMDESGAMWGSEAIYQAPPSGTFTLDDTPPVEGAYHGVDPMGLFWSMRPVVDDHILDKAAFKRLMVAADAPNLKLGRPNLESLKPVRMTLQCFVDDRLAARASFTQRLVAEDVTVTSLLDEGIPAKVYWPAGTPRGAVISITGSNGGYEGVHAPLLASHGFVAMSLALFGVPGAPAQMHDLPIEHMARAIDWLSAATGGQRVGVIGWSKGAESALVAASYVPEKIAAVVACVPCHYVMSGNDGAEDFDLPGWTLNGAPLAYHLLTTPDDIAALLAKAAAHPDEPIVLRPPYEEGYKTRLTEAAMIPVERAQCAFMFVSGGDDQNWPSTTSAHTMIERLKHASYQRPVVHLDYPDAGHLISAANTNKAASDAIVHLVNKKFILCGGTPSSNAAASRDSWPKIINFLAQHAA
ncbi:MAG: acyl-CoA thioesterase/bile acid-CoA:amino acid N-acyltransferase family protein, partial [Pseudomonadota bacterium]